MNKTNVKINKSMLLLLLPAGALWAQPPADFFFESVPALSAAPLAGGPALFQARGNVGFISGEMIGGAPVKNAPYSAEAVTETAQTLADGNRIVNQSSTLVYRDSLGRERREQSFPSFGNVTGQAAHKMIMISDPVAGVNYSLDPDSKTAIKLPSPPAGLPPGANVTVQRFGTATAGSANAGAAGGPHVIMYSQKVTSAAAPSPTIEQLAPKTIEGVQAEGTRTTVVIAAGQIGNDLPIQIVNEQWRSPDLQVIVLSQHSDPRMGATNYSLKNISRSEPSSALFQVPSDYAVKDAPAMNIEKFTQKAKGVQ